MKFSAAATTVLPVLVSLFYPNSIYARLSGPTTNGVGNDATTNVDNDNNKKGETRFLTWNINSQKASTGGKRDHTGADNDHLHLDEYMKAKLATAKNNMKIDNQEKADRMLSKNSLSKSKKGHDMVRPIFD